LTTATYVWEALGGIKPYLAERLEPNVGPVRTAFGDFVPRTVVLHQGRLITDGFTLQPGDPAKKRFGVFLDGRKLDGAVVIYGGASLASEAIQLAPGAVVEPGAMIKGPTYIGADSEVRQGAYLRGDCLVGAACVVGHVTEVKHAVFLSGAKAGHFAYVGDSILGRGVNLGAGTKLANLKIIEGEVTLSVDHQAYATGLRKLGAIIGDGCELGCNTVTNPGVLLGPRSLVTPNATVPAGYYKPRSLIRTPKSTVR
jgi:bifunctional N-acetylglucosamine-1-phosphate-uridyltransferase/glucosamine-1-phosphate-acetyltransferase GlmU-like protein